MAKSRTKKVRPRLSTPNCRYKVCLLEVHMEAEATLSAEKQWPVEERTSWYCPVSSEAPLSSTDSVSSLAEPAGVAETPSSYQC